MFLLLTVTLYLDCLLSALMSSEMVNGCDRDSIVLDRTSVNRTGRRDSCRHSRTNASDLQLFPRTSPQITSRGTLTFPACLAADRRFLLLSKPIVHIAPDLSRGSGKYFPFPVPESRPTQPVGMSERNRETIGHGYSRSSSSGICSTCKPES